MTVRHIFEISEDDHPRLVTHARDIWWTLDFANAFVSPGVNSRGELVPSHGASTANPPTPGSTSIYLALHLGVWKLLGYLPLFVVLMKYVVTMNYYVMQSRILLNLLFGTGFPNDLQINF
jgi:hypothetical protein